MVAVNFEAFVVVLCCLELKVCARVFNAAVSSAERLEERAQGSDLGLSTPD